MLDHRPETTTDDFVPFVTAGARATGQFRCADCGYGITIHAELPICPMCAGTTWEETEWSPFSNAPGFRSLSRPTPRL